MTREQTFSRLTSVNLNPKSVLVLTHTDLDGAGCAILAKLAFSKIASSIEVQHLDNNKMSAAILAAVKHHAFDLIIAMDISLSSVDAIEADKYISNNFLLIDHHPTAMHLNKYNWACVYGDSIEDSDRAQFFSSNAIWHTSATALIYEYFMYKQQNYLADYSGLLSFVHEVSAYDTWDWRTTSCAIDSEHIQTLNDLCYAYGLNRFVEIMASRLSSNEPTTQSMDRLLITIEQEHVDAYLSKLTDKIVTGFVGIDGEKYTYAGCISTCYVAQVFEYLRGHYNSDLYIVNTGNSVSLRTNRQDIDLSSIASKLGGGGHQGAAGFPLSNEAVKDIITLPFSSSKKTSVFC